MSTSTRKLKRLREQGIKQRAAIVETIEICSSFSRKFNLKNYGGPDYESIDYLTSLKLTCRREDQKMVTESLFSVCEEEVETVARKYLARYNPKLARKEKAV